ncbi:hypothetical protein [Nonomuraea basaltis]|uniref:hypothetical protein n=1 Tax=Nonomuraea basaltis TaxID=2495887 RepID=UPI00110C4351|nr:hypothetical protein [Nonomuraea basaltis]TMR92552.1 hypothetical protein EJK15_43910 [Nonomuraea basaltis]
MKLTRSDLIRILFDAQRRGEIPQPVMHRFPPLALGDLDPRRITEMDEENQTIKVFVWTSEPRPELARAYFDVIARHLEGNWLLDVVVAHGEPADRTAQISQLWFHGPAEPVPVRLLPTRPLQPAIPA